LELQYMSDIGRKIKYKGGISTKPIKLSKNNMGNIKEFQEKTSKTLKNLMDGIYLYCPLIGDYHLSISCNGEIIKSFDLTSIERKNKPQKKPNKKRKNETIETITKKKKVEKDFSNNNQIQNLTFKDDTQTKQYDFQQSYKEDDTFNTQINDILLYNDTQPKLFDNIFEDNEFPNKCKTHEKNQPSDEKSNKTLDNFDSNLLLDDPLLDDSLFDDNLMIQNFDEIFISLLQF
jgi:hypothetical protein